MPSQSPPSLHPPPSPSQRSRIPKRIPSLSLQSQGTTSTGAAQPASPRLPSLSKERIRKKEVTVMRGASMPVGSVSANREAEGPETRERDPAGEGRGGLVQLSQPSPHPHQHHHPPPPPSSTPSRPSTHAHPPQIRFPSSSSSSQPIPSSSRSTHSHLHPHPQLSSSPSSSPHSYSPSTRRCSLPRPKLERPSSTVYTSFPLPPPRTPGDFAEEERRARGPLWRWFAPSSNPGAARTGEAAGAEGDLEAGSGKQYSSLGERARLLGVREELRPHRDVDEAAGGVRQEGLPKVTRSCLVAEVRCYGKYILPPLLLFVFLALSLSLYIYGRALEHEEESHPGSGAVGA